jgi:hypothetical protein
MAIRANNYKGVIDMTHYEYELTEEGVFRILIGGYEQERVKISTRSLKDLANEKAIKISTNGIEIAELVYKG